VGRAGKQTAGSFAFDCEAGGGGPNGGSNGCFRHELLLYAGQTEFVERTAGFIGEGLARDEPVMVVVSAAKIALLEDRLGSESKRVEFHDMDAVGANPARIIPAWREFVATYSASDRPLRGIGEPVGPDRALDELVECQRHESLLNLAFGSAPSFRLLCPYDTDTLDPAVIEEACRSHPYLAVGDAAVASHSFRGIESIEAPFDEPLPEPSPAAERIGFDAAALASMRSLVLQRAEQAGLSSGRARDLVLAVNEVASNSVRHGGGSGLLLTWETADAVLCEVRDAGRIGQPLAGRELPAAGQAGGWGLWLANQFCDLVQVRVFPEGSVVRLHMRRGC
jgi:anti-sigma regulatory factor (Ser/Thr protein kinase)